MSSATTCRGAWFASGSRRNEPSRLMPGWEAAQWGGDSSALSPRLLHLGKTEGSARVDEDDLGLIERLDRHLLFARDRDAVPRLGADAVDENRSPGRDQIGMARGIERKLGDLARRQGRAHDARGGVDPQGAFIP